MLGGGQEPESYSNAFAAALGGNVFLLALGAGLSLWLPEPRQGAGRGAASTD
ncbi:hypothetical protein [Rhizobium sp. NPDC090279]|uniref:hypothetical protein n=1 Tax=Rhizobium sp. NPDC090279 TaxID=3364499 RepID=UPI00383A7C32